jgi:hypothetical protein
MPTRKEADLAKAHIAKMEAYHQAHPAPPKAAPKPIVHTITSELTGQSFRFVQQENPVEYEANLHPSEVSPQVRALTDFTLALLNTNEFVYLY